MQKHNLGALNYFLKDPNSLSLGYSEDTKALPSSLQVDIKIAIIETVPHTHLGDTDFDTSLCVSLSAQRSFIMDVHPALALSKERAICAHEGPSVTVLHIT